MILYRTFANATKKLVKRMQGNIASSFCHKKVGAQTNLRKIYIYG